MCGNTLVPVPVVNTVLLLQGAQVQSLAKELRFHMLLITAKKKKKTVFFCLFVLFFLFLCEEQKAKTHRVLDLT